VLAGSEEIVPLGAFMLSKAEVKDSVGGSPSISLDGYDFSRRVQRDKFTDTYTVDQGTNISDAIQTILQRTFPGVDYDLATTTMTANSPIVYDANSDPWQACQDLAASAGFEVFFDVNGNVKLAPPADINHLPAPVFSYIEGQGCTMLDLSNTFTDDPGYNGVVLTGEAAGDDTPPVRSIVWDDEPSSPTYYKGPYGAVPMFVTDSTVTTQADADTAAAAQLNLVLGFSSQLSISTTVNPALDANDVVQIQRERSGVNDKYAIDTLTIPMRANTAASIGLRQKRTV
jgi:hypothetical protein